MAFKEYREVCEPLAFPINGKVYTVPPVSVDVGLLLNDVRIGEVDLSAYSAEDQWRLVLGDALDEMIGDRVPQDAVERAALAATADITAGREIAEAVWEAGIDPKWRAAMIQEAAAKASLTTLPSTEVASEIPSPDSMSGTNTQPATQRGKRAATARKRSDGRKSANSGA